MATTDPLARVLYLLLRDDIPYGKVEAAIERARTVMRDVPDNHLGFAAQELSRKVATLDHPPPVVD